MKPVLIVWEDAWADTYDSSRELEPLVTYTLGWEVYKNKKGYGLITSAYPLDKSVELEGDHITYIPKAMVVRRVVLDLDPLDKKT